MTCAITSMTGGAEEDGKDSDGQSSVGLFDDDKEPAKVDESFDVDAEIERLSQEMEQLPSQIENSTVSESIDCMEDSRIMDESKVGYLYCARLQQEN